MDTARRYRLFAEYEARGNSRVYEQWCRQIAGDSGLIDLIEQLPHDKRQPNLVLASARYLGAPEASYISYIDFRDWLTTHWADVYDTACTHSTQTNECGRSAVLLPVLARLPGPLSLIEVGASAGLCLYPDRFSYRYATPGESRVHGIDPPTGPSPVLVRCTVTGQLPLPTTLPDVVYRAGVDLNPLNVADPGTMRWLEALVWPGQDERLARLRAAATLVRNDPPTLVAGDLTDTVGDLVHAAPSDSTVVVFGSAVLNYLAPNARSIFEDVVRRLPCHWVTNEGVGIVQSALTRLPKPLNETRGQFVITLDGVPLAYAGGHGQTLDWIPA